MNAKQLLTVLILLLPLLLTAQTHPVSVIDPPAGGNPPAGRHTDRLVIYTDSLEREHTGTNEYGLEASVVDGVVHELGGNNRAIPQGGFIVSGHGQAATWIGKYLQPGTTVTFNKEEVRIDMSAEAKARSLRFRLDQLEMNERERQQESLMGLALPLVRSELDKAIEANDFTNLEKLEKIMDRLVEIRWEKELEKIPSPKGEIRGAWHRLEEYTPQAIAQLADELSSAGINVFYPETIYGSQAIFDDTTGLYPKFKHFGETDALEVLIEECHARGIEVHAWVHNFFIGVEGNAEEPPLLAIKYPEWLAQDRQGRQKAVHEPGYMYLNPAHPEARKALIEAYKELVKNYDIDGFQFDYIRYSNARFPEDWDYSDFTRNKVKEELGFDPLKITPEDNPEQWQEWLDWRERQITSFVQEAGDAISEIKPEIILSADVFPELENTIITKAQNWADWAKNGYIDAVVPMAYYRDMEPVADAVREVQVQTNHATDAIGLAPFLNITPEQLVDQILATRKAGAEGQVLFSWNTTTPAMRKALAKGPWKVKTRAEWK